MICPICCGQFDDSATTCLTCGAALNNVPGEMDSNKTMGVEDLVPSLEGPTPMETMDTPMVNPTESSPMETMETPMINPTESNPVETIETPIVDSTESNPVETMDTPIVDFTESSPMETIETPIESNPILENDTTNVAVPMMEPYGVSNEETSSIVPAENLTETQTTPNLVDVAPVQELGESTFDGTLGGLIGHKILFGFLSSITLGIGFPWAFCLMEKWEIGHTIVNGKRLKFDGTGSQLLGKWIVWLLLTIITFGIYGLWVGIKMRKWKTSHIHFAD